MQAERAEESTEQVRVPNIEKAFEEIGGVGRFQAFSLSVIILGITSVSYWIFGMGFLLQVPGYLCTDAYGKTVSCTTDQICSAESEITDW